MSRAAKLSQAGRGLAIPGLHHQVNFTSARTRAVSHSRQFAPRATTRPPDQRRIDTTSGTRSTSSIDTNAGSSSRHNGPKKNTIFLARKGGVLWRHSPAPYMLSCRISFVLYPFCNFMHVPSHPILFPSNECVPPTTRHLFLSFHVSRVSTVPYTTHRAAISNTDCIFCYAITFYNSIFFLLVFRFYHEVLS